MIQRLAAIAAIIAVVVLRATATTDPGFPYAIVPQGVSAMNVDGTHVFLDRQGEVLTAYASTSGNDALVWCPAEQVFVSPVHFELFNRAGERVDGPAARDMTTYRVRIDNDLQVFVDVKHPRFAHGRSGATISGAVGDAYTRARAGEKASFCENPVR